MHFLYELAGARCFNLLAPLFIYLFIDRLSVYAFGSSLNFGVLTSICFDASFSISDRSFLQKQIGGLIK